MTENFPLSQIKNDLERHGWAKFSNVYPEEFLHKLQTHFLEKKENEEFEQASVGKDTRNFLRENIRLSETSWVDDWQELSELSVLREDYEKLMVELNEYFYLSMKRFESQLALYPSGGFYKKHIDQLKGGLHRQVTGILYLNNCPEGGELVIYERENKNKIAATISPRIGDMVFFFSSQIYHEVLPTYFPRYSLTTWFRDDLLAL